VVKCVTFTFIAHKPITSSHLCIYINHLRPIQRTRMSVFSKIKLSKKAAKQHKEKEKGKAAEPVKTPYKHIPTHAAFDALSGAPSSWKHEDRPKIREQHKRRSKMVISRTESSLSTATMSHMNAAAGPNSQVPPLPRNSSYSSYNPTWFDRGGDLNYSFDKAEPVSKRQKPSRGHSYHDSGIGASIGPSPLASHMQSEGTLSSFSLSHAFSISNTKLGDGLTSYTEVSPVVSSGNSTTSNSSDNLEMPQNPHRMSIRPLPIVYAEKDIFDKLHTSTTRKLGEAPLYDSPPVLVKNPVATTKAVPQQKQKKQRWSLLGKKNNAAISAI
jgi:hypothetical protein